MFKFFKRKSRKQPEIKIVDLRENPQPITPVNGDIDPIHALMIGAAMQSDKIVIGNFDGDNLEIKD